MIDCLGFYVRCKKHPSQRITPRQHIGLARVSSYFFSPWFKAHSSRHRHFSWSDYIEALNINSVAKNNHHKSAPFGFLNSSNRQACNENTRGRTHLRRPNLSCDINISSVPFSKASFYGCERGSNSSVKRSQHHLLQGHLSRCLISTRFLVSLHSCILQWS